MRGLAELTASLLREASLEQASQVAGKDGACGGRVDICPRLSPRRAPGGPGTWSRGRPLWQSEQNAGRSCESGKQ